MTVADLIKAAYSNIGACDIEEGPSAAQYAQGLQSLNSMLKSWSAGLTLYGLFDESFTLTPGKADYSVVAGGDFDTAWTFLVESAYIRDSQNIDYPLQIVTAGQYENVALKTVSARPEYLYYNPKGYPTGTATFYFVPDKAYTLFWSAKKVITEFASIESTVAIGPEYEEALEYNLSLRLAPKAGSTPSAEVKEIARTAKSRIMPAIEPAEFDGSFNKGRRYNVYSDTL
jgi:hypothetical protein